jgi:hypothetical protein
MDVMAQVLLKTSQGSFFTRKKWTFLFSSRVDALAIDRSMLFPMGVGLNAGLGRILVELGFSRTIDYRQHYQAIMDGVRARVDGGHRATEGRAFWTEVGPDGYLSKEFVQVFPDSRGTRPILLFCSWGICFAGQD